MNVGGRRLRVLLVYQGYPTISHTYMLNEVDALAVDHDVMIAATGRAELPAANHRPHVRIGDRSELDGIVSEFKPDVMHGHYLHLAPTLAELGERHGIGFTLRSHSFDVLKHRTRRRRLQYETRAVNTDVCLGVLAMPFARPVLEDIGIRPDRLVECWPVIRYDRFFDRSPNGDGVMNTGAVIPKKQMSDFVDLASMTDRRLRLYPAGFMVRRLEAYNQAQGSPVEICAGVEPEAMPAIYKQHEWLVYTGSFRPATIGWPMAVAEAQAAGLGVVVPNVRPDLRDYIGEGGFLYESIADVPEIISQPFPDELREVGFEHAKKSGIENHLHRLTDLWEAARLDVSSGSRKPFTRYWQATAPLRLARRLT